MRLNPSHQGTSSENTGSSRMGRAWCSPCGLNLRFHFSYSSRKGKKSPPIVCPASGLFRIVRPKTRITNMLVTADLLRLRFYLWEVKIDFLPLVTLKSPLCPFRHALRDSGVRDQRIRRHSCREASGGEDVVGHPEGFK